MKKILFFMLVLSAQFAFSQQVMPRPEDLPKDQQKRYRADLKAYDKQAKENEASGFDFWLDKQSSVPTYVTTATTAVSSSQTNWGEQALLSPVVRSRIRTECKFPVTMKVADTGGKLTHTDLQKGQLPGAGYTGESDLLDGHGHSTHCFGIVAADQFGAAWELIDMGLLKVKPIKVLTNSGGGSFSFSTNMVATERDEDKAIIAAGGAVAYSCSWGGGTEIIPALDNELKQSTDDGIFFVFASGNTGGAVNFPGNSKWVITAASLDQSMAVSSFSSRGPEVHNAMPGRNINSTHLNNGYAVLSGTSMATPFLSSAVVVALSKWGKAAFPTLQSMKDYLRKCATDISPTGYDDASGWGTLFFLNILNIAPGGTPPPPPPPPPPTPPAEKVTVSTTFGNVALRYSFAGETMLRNLNILELELTAQDTTAEAALAAVQRIANAYFCCSYIAQIPTSGAEGGLHGAVYWVGTFLNYAGKAGEFRVKRIVAKGEGVNDLPIVLDGVFNRFTDDTAPDSYDSIPGKKPKLVSITGTDGVFNQK